ncbi:gag/pol protein [Cucumis melo var. makuwa]|uniref:Gag/pol protein n=1 Tax=Cucumis melo var. makuwa TaxID=1194695 RepID=A0A5A7V9Q5_CUCMM|nr:gag/pol protein [Cucumis melo var. makuwa]
MYRRREVSWQPLNAFATNNILSVMYKKDEFGDKMILLQSSRHLLSYLGLSEAQIVRPDDGIEDPLTYKQAMNDVMDVKTTFLNGNPENSKKDLLSYRYGVHLSTEKCPKTPQEIEDMSNIPYAYAVGSMIVSEETLRFWGVTASVVGANSPLFGWICLDVELNKDFSYSSGNGMARGTLATGKKDA